MTAAEMVAWELDGRSFSNCNCAYGCPCQFNALPTHGDCRALVGYIIDKGRHGDVLLDGLKAVMMASWPGPIHEGSGRAMVVIDERATPAQREALLRIFSGQDTEPGATVWQVFSATLADVAEPVFAPIELDIDVDGRSARVKVEGLAESRGEPIRNPVTGEAHRARIDMPGGFEFERAEVGRGWTTARGFVQLDLDDSHGHFNRVRTTGHGVIRDAA